MPARSGGGEDRWSCGLPELLGVAAGRDVVGGRPEHADELGDDLLLGQLGDGRERRVRVGGLGDREVAGGPPRGPRRGGGGTPPPAPGGEPPPPPRPPPPRAPP